MVLALALLTVSTSPARAQAPDPFAVTAPSGKVYGATAAQLDHWRDIARRSSGRPRDAFQLLVNDAWMRAEADERGIVVAHEEVVREFRVQRRQSFPNRREYRRFLREYGQTTDDILFRIRSDLLSTRIREQVIAPAAASVTEADVDAHLAEHGIPRVPERRKLRFVVTERRRDALAARRELKAGASWKAVARRHSRDSSTRMPGVVRDHLERRLRRAVFAARVGRLVGPVSTRYGHYVFRVTHIRPGRDIPVARAREQARQVLVSEAQQETISAFVAEFDVKWTARTVCVERWRALPWCGN